MADGVPRQNAIRRQNGHGSGSHRPLWQSRLVGKGRFGDRRTHAQRGKAHGSGLAGTLPPSVILSFVEDGSSYRLRRPDRSGDASRRDGWPSQAVRVGPGREELCPVYDSLHSCQLKSARPLPPLAWVRISNVLSEIRTMLETGMKITTYRHHARLLLPSYTVV